MPGRMSLPLILAMPADAPTPERPSRLDRLRFGLMGRRRRERGWADRVHARDPWLRLVFGHRQIRGLHVAHEVVEVRIVVAAGPGDEVPAGGFHRVGFDAAAVRVNQPRPVLAGRTAFLRRLEEIFRGGGLVPGYARAVEQGYAVFHLGTGVTGARLRVSRSDRWS